MEEKKNFKAWPKGRPKSLHYPVMPIYQFTLLAIIPFFEENVFRG